MRPSWDDYFMSIAIAVSTRSNCIRRQVGAIIVRDKRIISTGYNGTPRGIKNCDEGGCDRCAGTSPSGSDLAVCLCSHAEENSITQAAYHGIAIKDTTMYVTLLPCLMCAKMIINGGIDQIVHKSDDYGTDSYAETKDKVISLFEESGVELL